MNDRQKVGVTVIFKIRFKKRLNREYKQKSRSEVPLKSKTYRTIADKWIYTTRIDTEPHHYYKTSAIPDHDYYADTHQMVYRSANMVQKRLYAFRCSFLWSNLTQRSTDHRDKSLVKVTLHLSKPFQSVRTYSRISRVVIFTQLPPNIYNINIATLIFPPYTRLII